MKKKIKILMLTLVLLMGLAGCTSKKQTEKEQSMIKGYVEKDMSFDCEIGWTGRFYETTKGIMQVYVMNKQEVKCYEETDGKWAFKSFAGEKAMNDLKADGISAFSLQGDDWFYFVYNKKNNQILEDGEKGHDSYFAEIKDGKMVRNVRLVADNKLGAAMPDDLIRLDDEHLLVLSAYEKSACYDLNSGKLLSKWACYGISGIADDQKVTVYDNGGFKFSARGPSLSTYDKKTGELIEKIETPRMSDKGGFAVGTQGEIYVASAYSGINRLTPGGTVWEGLVAKEKTSLSIPNMAVRNMYVSSKNELYILFFDIEMAHPLLIKKYVYDEVVADKDRQLITVYGLHDNAMAKQALIAYGMKHPELNIKFEAGQSELSANAKDDQLKKLNTQLLAGEGPDLIILDGMPLSSYMKQGVLEDISGLEGSEGLFPFIQNAAVYDGKVYAYPTSMFRPMMWERGQLIGTVNSLKTLAAYKRVHPDEGVTPEYNIDIMLHTFYAPYQKTLINDQGEINEGELRQFFEDLKTIMGTGKYAEELSYNDSTLGDRGCYLTYLGRYNDGIWNMYTTVPKDVQALLIPLVGNEVSGGNDYCFLEDANNCEVQGLLGINARSQHMEIAKDILSYCLSCEAQSINSGEGFPVNQAACKSWLDGTGISKISVGVDFYGDHKPTVVEVRWSHEKELSDIYEHMAHVEDTIISDERFKEIIKEQLESYIKGEKTLDEAVEEVKAKMMY